MPIHPQTVIVKQENVPFKEIDNEGMLLNLKTGDYFTINEPGMFIWKSLNGRKNLGQVVKEVCSDYEVTEQKARQDVMSLIKELQKQDLVKIAK